jgi:hypothetical protein
MPHVIKRIFKELEKCGACGSYPSKPTFMYDWYSLYDGGYNDKICKKCAIREIGPKNKRLHEYL